MRAVIIVVAAAVTLAFAACGGPPEEKSGGAGDDVGTDEAAGDFENVKPPNVAGAFYPGDAEELARTVDDMVATAETQPRADVGAILVPHAGYVYSGAITAEAFAAVAGYAPETVVLFGPSHYMRFPGVAAPSYDAFETPLGVLAVDGELVSDVVAATGTVKYMDEPFDEEHCLEVQMPFVQRVLGDVKIAPFLFGAPDADVGYAFGEALGEVLADRNALTVVTSDLSHYHPYHKAVKLDTAFVDAFETGDPATVLETDESGASEVDAPAAVVAAMMAAEALGYANCELLLYKNSGDVTGDRSAVVGYPAGVITK
ncbi:MAG: AmmeMemoRadiSam system protein B [Candidatus Coatesbacteria bacterium]|nr:MAG: AmmeMemoRadiSam system protein B [Candidatus Coatesbacteria bacterium]